MAMKSFPAASDVVLHAKDSDKSERIIFPITRYENIIASPKVTNNVDSASGAPFLLLRESNVEIDEDELKTMCRSLNY